MSQVPKFEHYLRQAAIDAVLSEALELAGFGPLVPYSLSVVLAEAGKGSVDATALQDWTADKLLLRRETHDALVQLVKGKSSPSPRRRNHLHGWRAETPFGPA